MSIVGALKYTGYSSVNEIRVRFICSFQFFKKFWKCAVLYFFDNERVVVIKQSIMVLPVEKQYELSLIISILLKHQMSSSEVTGFAKCL